MRGEDIMEQTRDFHGKGSPPHARGRPKARSNKYNKEGITPACAGKTPQRRWGRVHGLDHPRMRGEDAVA